ncbi:MAG: hypothetical protein KDC34_09275 [Saprospiraceae bacterium]|nr:hypothetical protein [Saprospiraceae bacterium]
MNLHTFLTDSDKAVKTQNILKSTGNATLLRLKKDGLLDKHQSKNKALLVLLSGHAVYEEDGRSVDLKAVHDFVEIPEKVTHQLVGKADSLLLLIQ